MFSSFFWRLDLLERLRLRLTGPGRRASTSQPQQVWWYLFLLCKAQKFSTDIWNMFWTRRIAGKVSVRNGVAAGRRVEQIHRPPQESTNQTHMLVFFVSWLMIKMTWLYPKTSWWLLSNLHASSSSTPYIPLHSQTVAVRNWSLKPFCDWFMFITLHFSTVNAAETVSLRCIL